MSGPAAASDQPLSAGAMESLRAFLAMEAPALLQHMESELSAQEAEARLLEEIARPSVDAASLAPVEIFPGTNVGEAVFWSQQYLETLVRGFFRRLEIRESISAEEQLAMYRTMLLTRTIDDFLVIDLGAGPLPAPRRTDSLLASR